MTISGPVWTACGPYLPPPAPRLPKGSFASADLTTLQGGKLTHRRMFRKDFIDDATPGVASEGASKSASYPYDIACDNGLMHACNLVLKPGWTGVDEGGTR